MIGPLILFFALAAFVLGGISAMTDGRLREYCFEHILSILFAMPLFIPLWLWVDHPLKRFIVIGAAMIFGWWVFKGERNESR